MLDELFEVNPLEPRYSCHGFPCERCGTFVEAVLITPTQLNILVPDVGTGPMQATVTTEPGPQVRVCRMM